MLVTRSPTMLTRDCREFSSAFEHAVIGMALISPEGRFIQVNRAFSRMLGYTAVELKGSSCQSVTLPEDLPTDLKQRRQLLEGTIDHYQLEKRYLHRRGDVVQALLSVSLIRDDDGLPQYFISQIQDISGYRTAMQQLRAIGARLKTLVESLPFGLVMEDESRRILLTNRTFCDLLKLPLEPRTLIGESASSLNEDMRHLFARPEFIDNRMDEIARYRRPVHDETVELANGTQLQRDYVPVFVDDTYQGNLWIWRPPTGSRTGG